MEPKVPASSLKHSYRPSIRSLQEDFARRIAFQAMKKRREAKHGPVKNLQLTDNSEPWLENPNSVADYWYISEQIRKRTEQWKLRQTNS